MKRGMIIGAIAGMLAIGGGSVYAITKQPDLVLSPSQEELMRLSIETEFMGRGHRVDSIELKPNGPEIIATVHHKKFVMKDWERMTDIYDHFRSECRIRQDKTHMLWRCL